MKRSVYPTGFHWARDIKPHVGTETCMHAHVGFLARGQIHMEFPDGCTLDYVAPQVIVIEPGHDGRVGGDEPAIVIEFDFEDKRPPASPAGETPARKVANRIACRRNRTQALRPGRNYASQRGFQQVAISPHVVFRAESPLNRGGPSLEGR